MMLAPGVINAVILGDVAQGGYAWDIPVWAFLYFMCVLLYVIAFAASLLMLAFQSLDLRASLVKSPGVFLGYGRFLFFYSLLMILIGIVFMIIMPPNDDIHEGIHEKVSISAGFLFYVSPYLCGVITSRLILWLAKKKSGLAK